MTDQFKEWRGFTPILLVVIIVLGGITSFLGINTLNSMNDKTDKLFSIVGDLKTSFMNFRIDSAAHFATVDQELKDERVIK